MGERTIWVLLCTPNIYDAPDNVLVSFWFNKPGLQQLSKVWDIKLDVSNLDVLIDKWGKTLIDLSELIQGREVNIRGDMYRLRELSESSELDMNGRF